MKLSEITVYGGSDKSGNREQIETLTIRQGQVYSIVGFTGSGKSQLISDIEQMAQGDTVTGRRILINGSAPDYAVRYNPDVKLVAQLSQNMNFVLEMSVEEFLLMHAECRGIDDRKTITDEVLECANSLAGEPVYADEVLTRLSGGQSRALMIADVAVISRSPIILIDEIENAGIDRRRAMELLTDKGKIVLIVTHDPQLALLGRKRVVMENGGMSRILEITEGEKRASELLISYADKILTAQRLIRSGHRISVNDLELEPVEVTV